LKKFKWLGIVTLAFVILVLAIGGVTKAIFNSRYQAEIAAIKAKGEPLTPADLAGKPIPDAENGAVVYKKVFALIDSGKYDAPRKVLDEFVQPPVPDPTTVAKARQALAQVEPILNLVDEATARPKCRFPRDWSQGVYTLFPENARLRSISRSISSAALLNAVSGNMDESARYVELGLRHADCLKDEPALIQLMVRQAMIMMASQAMKRSLRYGDFSENRAEHVFDILGRVDLDHAFLVALEGERAAWLHEMATSPGYAAVVCAVPNRYQDNAIFQPACKALAFGYKHLCAKGDEAAWLQFMAEQIAGVKLSYGEARSKGLFRNRTDWPMYAPMGKLDGDNYGNIQFLRFNSARRITMDQMLLALQAYKARFGGYPATIQELKSKLGWKLPKDPFSGKDFIYKRQAKGFILYSVGPDMKDDGGRALPSNSVDLDSKGDIVLRWDR